MRLMNKLQRFWWNIQYTWRMWGITNELRSSWQAAAAWDNEDIDDMTPDEALSEELSHWYD